MNCGICKNWKASNEEDETAPEGRCSLEFTWDGPLWIDGKHPTFAYHPNTLRSDNCKQFETNNIQGTHCG